MRTPLPERPAWIPEAAWSRPIGLPHEDAATVSRLVMSPMFDDGPFNGAPLGGLGAGSIGRTYRGDFARWHLDIGTHHYETRPANMFSVFMRQGERQVTQALFTDTPRDGSLGAWQWNYPVGAGGYYALYPRSWFAYEWDSFPAALSVEQLSPVIPGHLRESSLPVALFQWTASNPTSEPVEVGVLLTWENLLGAWMGRQARGGQVHEPFQATVAGTTARGVVLRNPRIGADEEMGGTLAIAALEVPGADVSFRTRFLAKGDGADIWADFAEDGRLDDVADLTPSERNEVLGAGVAVTFTLAPGQTLHVPFALAWDLPVTTFGPSNDGTSWYKRYTAYTGRSGDNAAAIALEALERGDMWREQIAAWQAPILDDPARPLWYKTALFNELYFLADGQTAWEAGRVGGPPPAPDDVGGFLYIECIDYPHYATFDVDFYASFALLELFPDLERRLMRDYADTVVGQDLRPHPIQATGEVVPRKLTGAVPHDLGGPLEDPWLQPNNYRFQDVNRWKDLNAKFVLRLYRDVLLLGDAALARDTWPAARLAMAYLAAMDHDGDGIPENEGIPDQTYDTWPVTGVSAYSGGLWLAALGAARELARMNGDEAAAAEYDAQLESALGVYEETLWNGRYYDYDASDSAYYDSIMADQLAGQWYADLLGIRLLPDDHVASALDTVLAYNVRRYGDGRMGAVNGMRPDGSVDASDIQSQEMWVGTSYAIASHMLLRRLDEAAWETAYGVYRVTYETSGLWFRTPEAFNADNTFRASLYQRPLAVWAMETALRVRDP